MKEIWKDVPGLEGKYQVSTYGGVKSLDRMVDRSNGTSAMLKGRILTPTKSKKGYLSVIIGGKSYRVHRLVWETFVGPIQKGMQVNHIDEDKTNNRLDNLNLMTPSENTNWGTRNDRVMKHLGKWVIKLTLNNEILHFYPSTKKAAKENGLQSNTISECCNGKRKSYGGFIWKFAS